MFLVIGLLIVVFTILATLYFFVFRRLPYLVNKIIVFAIFFLSIAGRTLHTIIGGILFLCIGLFVVYFENIRKVKLNKPEVK